MTLHTELLSRRTSGVLMPLAAMKTASDWGVGDFSSLCEWVRFLGGMGARIVQILPLHETAPGQTCPYSALSSFAIDPVYIDVMSVPDVQASAEAREEIAKLQEQITVWHHAPQAPMQEVKSAKLKVLWLAYQTFLQTELAHFTPPAQAFDAYRSANAHWLRDYTLFRALKEFYRWQSWTQWPQKLAACDKTAVDEFEIKYREYVDFFSYVQWQADLQLRSARSVAREANVYLFGDIAFGTNLDSAEVWSGRENFRLDCEVGAPPDPFSATGQCWGLPAYDWCHIQSDDFGLWRRKIGRAVELYDLFRLDHLVGFFRTYIFMQGSPAGTFDITTEQEQVARGQAFLDMVLQSARGALPVGEDLGVIPTFVRHLLSEKQIPGYKVLRWEREDNGYYREPRNYPMASVAVTSTHDTETVHGWWITQPQQERANIWEMISAQKTDGNVPFTLETQRAILRRVLDSGSAIVMFSWQDIVGTLDRVNVPGTVSAENWVYRSAYTPQEAAQVYAPQLEMYSQLLQETQRA